MLRIDSGRHAPLSTKVKNPTLAQNARMGHPTFKYDPEFKILRKPASS